MQGKESKKKRSCMSDDGKYIYIYIPSCILKIEENIRY